MANAKNQTNPEAGTQASFQVIRTPGWVVYGEYPTHAEAQAAADAAQKTDDGGNVFVHVKKTEIKKTLISKLTLEILDSLSIGDSVCDMHYGLPSFGEDVREIMESCCVNVDVANSLIGDALTSIGLNGYHQMNKFLYVVGKDDAGVTCAYSYDKRYAKVISFGLNR